MKATVLLLAGLAISALGQSGKGPDAQGEAVPGPGPVIQVDFSDPGLSPSQWTLTIRPDGSGHFRSETGKPTDSETQNIGTPAVDRDVHLSAQFAARVFAQGRVDQQIRIEECVIGHSPLRGQKQIQQAADVAACAVRLSRARGRGPS